MRTSELQSQLGSNERESSAGSFAGLQAGLQV